MEDENAVADIDAEDFIVNNVFKSQPRVFKKFLEQHHQPNENEMLKKVGNEKCNYSDFRSGSLASIEAFLALVNVGPLRSTPYGFYSASEQKFQVQCRHPLLSRLVSDRRLMFQTGMRMWKHKAGHFTRGHYDGNTINIFNFSLVGRKTFWLAPPSTFAVWPLSNVTLRRTISRHPDTIKIVLEPGDLLFIPACWFHCVRTDEDAQNINMGFFHIDSGSILNKRDVSMIQLNMLFDTPFYQEKENMRIFDRLYAEYDMTAMATTWATEIGWIVVLAAFFSHKISQKHSLVTVPALSLLALGISAGVRYHNTLHNGVAQLPADSMAIAIGIGVLMTVSQKTRNQLSMTCRENRRVT